MARPEQSAAQIWRFAHLLRVHAAERQHRALLRLGGRQVAQHREHELGADVDELALLPLYRRRCRRRTGTWAWVRVGGVALRGEHAERRAH